MNLPENIEKYLKPLGKEIVPFLEKHPNEEVILQRILLPDNNGKIWYLTDDEGRLRGLNLNGLGLEEKDFRFLEEPEFQYIQAIGLGRNRIKNLAFPTNLDGLEFLDISDNKSLEKLVFQKGIESLKKLDISNCQLKELVLPSGFDQLRIIFLSNNESLRDLKLKGKYPELEYFYVSNGSLSSFSLPDIFPKLQYLVANDNQIERLPLGSKRVKFPELETLELKKNNIKEISTEVLLDMPKLINLSITDNPLPQSILSNIGQSSHEDLEFLRRYFGEIEERGTEIDNECKILLIGNGNVGKSTFLKRLIHDDFEYEWKSTHGIIIEERYEGDHRTKELLDPYIWNIWDFAGQDIYHATHRLFMQANAVYLVLWDHETENTDFYTLMESGEERPYENYSLMYWLHYAQEKGKGSPALLVQTKRDRDGRKEVPSEIYDVFDQEFIIAAHQIESSKSNIHKNGYYGLLASINSAIEQLKEQKPIPALWEEVRERIREYQEGERNWLSLDEFDQLAKDYDEPGDILRWLTQSGAVFYQEDLFKEIILDQQWAINAIYTLFDRDKFYYKVLQQQKGEFSGSDLASIWTDYPEKERELFVSFMQSCEMCYETTLEPDDENTVVEFAKRTFIAPQLLPERNEKAIADFWSGKEVIYLKYFHKHFHYGVIQSFIVRTYHLATQMGDSRDTRDVWKMGIRIKEKKEYAEIEAFKNRIEARVTKGGSFLVNKIRNEIEDLNEQMGTLLVSVDGEKYVNITEIDNLGTNEQIRTEDGSYYPVQDFISCMNHDQRKRFTASREERNHIYQLRKVDVYISDNRIKEALKLLKQKHLSTFKT